MSVFDAARVNPAINYVRPSLDDAMPHKVSTDIWYTTDNQFWDVCNPVSLSAAVRWGHGFQTVEHTFDSGRSVTVMWNEELEDWLAKHIHQRWMRIVPLSVGEICQWFFKHGDQRQRWRFASLEEATHFKLRWG